MNTDFTGFSFDGIHSSRLNIHRVSSSDRYTEELFPEINDRATEITGMNGQYYFGSDFGVREFEIQIAFDEMTEMQFRQMRRLFGNKKICELIFDERPYKVYLAKIKDPIELEYICFDQNEYVWSENNHEGYIPGSIDHKVYTGEKNRIYKGEGKINLICYFPFAKQQFKILDKYTNEDPGNVFTTYSNVDEWSESSGLLSQELFDLFNIDKVIELDPHSDNYNLQIPVYNPGDLDVGFYLYLPFIPLPSEGPLMVGIIPESGDYIKIYGDDNGLLLRPIYQKKSDADSGILIDTNNHIIQGVSFDPIVAAHDRRQKPWTLTGTIYNEYIKVGDFPHIKRTDWYLDNQQFKQAIYLNCKDREGQDVDRITIKYDYLYF